MNLRKLHLEDGEQIKIGVDREVCMWITRYGDKLKVEGPLNNMKSTAMLSKDGLKLTVGMNETTTLENLGAEIRLDTLPPTIRTIPSPSLSASGRDGHMV